MTTRDPRSRDPARPLVRGGVREPTQSLQIEPDDGLDDSHPSLALGTHEASRRDHTKVESPGARSKTPAPPARAQSSRPPPVPRNPDDPEERVGVVMGSYRVTELLGKGGMGYVYRAEHIKLGREVALKLLRSDYSRRRDAVARFFQEARTVNRVRHRNIVDVTDFVELDDGTTFIIMEFLQGQSLGKWARTGIDLPRALAVLVQICDGLGAAHAVSVVHRDLKPDNVIVVPTSDGAELVKLLDFGVAKLLNRDDEDIGFQTAAGSVIGTPAYMSPEQAGGMAVDARSDIYSLGAIMYELFCGQPMFRGRSFGEYVRKHLTEMPILPHATAGGVNIDPVLEGLIMKCLEKEPDRRFGHILELRDALLHMLGGMETHPPGWAALTASGLRPPPTTTDSSVVLLSSPMSQVSSVHPSQVQYAPYGQQTHHSQLAPPGLAPTPWWVWFVGGAVAVSIGIGAAVWYAGRSEKPAAPGPEPIAVVTPAAKPSAQPIETPAAVVTPSTLIELRFDSLPSGSVYADGKSAELCRTPCSFNIDLQDGGPADRRTFVVKSEGYRDASVVVDLTSPQREFSVTLVRPEPSVVAPVATPAAASKRTKPRKPEPKVAEPAPTPTSPTPAVVAEPKEDPDHLIDPATIEGGKRKKPAETTRSHPAPDGKIDPADTLDPFHRKRP